MPEAGVKQRSAMRSTGMIVLAVIFVAMGIVFGAIWAEVAWGRFWNWDAKETVSMITWVLYAAYLHARATAGWKGRSAAWLALIGMATLWFNFIGINYFSSTSQHSYAAPAVVEAPVVPGGSPGV